MSTFNKDILISWSSFQIVPVLLSEIGNQYLWHNTNITKPNGATLYSPRLSKIGINQVMDLIENRKIFSIKKLHNIRKIRIGQRGKMLTKTMERKYLHPGHFQLFKF